MSTYQTDCLVLHCIFALITAFMTIGLAADGYVFAMAFYPPFIFFAFWANHFYNITRGD